MNQRNHRKTELQISASASMGLLRELAIEHRRRAAAAEYERRRKAINETLERLERRQREKGGR